MRQQGREACQEDTDDEKAPRSNMSKQALRSRLLGAKLVVNVTRLQAASIDPSRGDFNPMLC